MKATSLFTAATFVVVVMSFEVVEATLADIPSLVTLHYAAFRRGPSAFKERNVPMEARNANLAAFFENKSTRRSRCPRAPTCRWQSIS